MNFYTLIFLTAVCGQASAGDWTYSDIDAWVEEYPTCRDTANSLQSPFDIITADVVVNKRIKQLKFTQSYFDLLTLKLENDGHTIKASLLRSTTVEVSGATLGSDSYQFLQFHFHWGSNMTNGAEYYIDGKTYPMSIHMVHKNTKYEDVSTALANSDGLLVLSFFFEFADAYQPNTGLGRITRMINKVQNSGDKANLKIRLGDFFRLVPDFNKFITFAGSLTTPPCSEAVTWFVFPSPMKGSKNQLDRMNGAFFTDGSPMTNNYRPLQMSNGREMETNMK